MAHLYMLTNESVEYLDKIGKENMKFLDVINRQRL